MPRTIAAGKNQIVIWTEPTTALNGSALDFGGTVVYFFDAAADAIRRWRSGGAFPSITSLVQYQGYQVIAGSIALSLPDSTLGFGNAPSGSVVPTYNTTLTGNQGGAGSTLAAPTGTSINFDSVAIAGTPERMNIFVGVTSNPANQVASLTFPSSYRSAGTSSSQSNGSPRRFVFVHAGTTYSSASNVFTDGNLQVA